jgi:hypothetical protein
MTTAIGVDEVLAALTFPVAGPGEGCGFAEIARRHGDFALAGVVTRVRSADGAVQEAVISGAAGHRLALLAQGADTGGNRTAAEITLHAVPGSDGSMELQADAAVFLSGRIAQFGRALAGDVSQRLFEQFAGAVDETARSGTAPDAGAAPSALALGARALADGIRRRVAWLRTLLHLGTGARGR